MLKNIDDLQVSNYYNIKQLLTTIYNNTNEKSIAKLKKEVRTMELQKVQRTTLTMKEAAEYLGISYWLINQLVRQKQIPCSKVGGKYLFRVQVLDEYLNKKEQDSVNY